MSAQVVQNVLGEVDVQFSITNIAMENILP